MNKNRPQEKIALIVIDVQKGLDDHSYYGGARNNEQAERNMRRILDLFRHLKLNIYHIQHASKNSDSPLFPDKPGFEIKDEVLPLEDEIVIVKNTNSAFINTSLADHLTQSNISTIVLIGLTTNHCVSSTARMGANLGYETLVIADATAAFDSKGVLNQKYDAELVHQITLANLKDEFAQILTTEELLNQLTI